MKKIIVTVLVLASLSFAQVFNTAQTLKNGKMSIGIEPALFTNSGNNDFGLYLHGGYGISRDFDLGIKLGIGQDETYFGADLEWALRGISPYISFAAGAHVFGDAGLDGTLNFTFPINRSVNLYTGYDLDVVFGKKTENGEEKTDIRFPSWLFLGTEIGFRRNMTLLLEVEIGVTESASNIFGGGINFYL